MIKKERTKERRAKKKILKEGEHLGWTPTTISDMEGENPFIM
jgi:hypothetical protein